MQSIDMLFGEPLIQKDIVIDNKKLEKHAYKLKKETGGRVVSNYGGWQSEFIRFPTPFNGVERFSPPSPVLEPLVQEIKACYPLLRQAYNLKDDVQFLLPGLWININGKHNFNMPHHHFSPGCLYSGVYYVKTPNNCGDIRFVNANKLFNANTELFKNYSVSLHGQLPVQAGKALFFPAWLEHFVFPNESQEDRISIAFNLYGHFEGTKPKGFFC